MESKVSQNGDISIEEMIEKLRKVNGEANSELLISDFLFAIFKHLGAQQPVMHLSFILFILHLS